MVVYQTNENKAIVLLSGGIDSAVCCAYAQQSRFSIYALSFMYGQRHKIEIDAAKRLAAFFNAKDHMIISNDLTMFSGSSLTSSLQIPPARQSIMYNQDSIPNTYVPARNTIFLSYALAWAEVLLCKNIFLGVNAVDFSGYPDCRPEYIKKFEQMANCATKLSCEYNLHITLHTPLIHMTKSQIIKNGNEFGVDFSLTHSCYNPSPEGEACGMCESCFFRKRGFEEADVPDPTIYKDQNK